ncbi:MAG: nucleotide exchange factor GrpE [Alphaproteobacteria bacterium]
MNQYDGKTPLGEELEDALGVTIENVIAEPEPEKTREQMLEDELNHLKDQWLRALADTENLRKRSEREREEARKFASAGFAREMLAVGDNLRRALESCPKIDELPASVQSLISGIEMTERELLAAFERQGIELLDPLDEKFDPHFHQAMSEVADASKESGTILQVFQKGYVLNGRLLRPALVVVSK